MTTSRVTATAPKNASAPDEPTVVIERQAAPSARPTLRPSFDLFDAIEGGDAKVVEPHRFTVLLVLVVILADDSRLLPSPSDRPTDTDGSSRYTHEFERPLRMLLVKRIAGDRPFTDRNRQPANFGHHVKRHEKAEQTRFQAISPNQRLRRRVAVYLDIVGVKLVDDRQEFFVARA